MLDTDTGEIVSAETLESEPTPNFQADETILLP